jgi:Uncharacterised nucleotidyltransferase
VTSPALAGVAAAVATACGLPSPRQPGGPVDWPEFVRLVTRHHVASLVQRSGWLAQAAAPDAVGDELRRLARSDALRSLRLLALQRDAVAALATAGVEAVVLKGSTIAVDAYGEPAARGPRDLDVLVRPDALPHALRTLRSQGYGWLGWLLPEDPPPAEPETFDHLPRLPLVPHVSLGKDGLELELHSRLFANARLMPVNPHWLSRPRLLDVQGDAVPALPLDAQWLYVLVHGADHLWSRMKWLADVAALAIRHPQLAQPAPLAATDAGYHRMVAAGLLAAEATFGPFLTPGSRSWAAGVRGTRLLVGRSLAALRAAGDRPARIAPRELPVEIAWRLALRPDAAYRGEVARQLLLEAGRNHEAQDPGAIELAAGPLRWTRRAARRLRRPATTGMER